MNQSRSGGASLSGSEQIIVSLAGMWKATVTVAVRGESSNLAARAFVAQMEGRAGTVLVPKWDKYRPRNINGRQFSQALAVGYDAAREDEFNFDLSGFGQEETPHATVSGSAPLGATQIALNLLDGEGPRPGHYFGIGQQIYRCQQVWQENVGDPTIVQFWPRLRAPAPSGTTAIIDRPVCLMRFATDDTGDIALSRAGSGMVTFDFVEAW
ncbi:hypothetical protein [Devosia submarina]|uniref:hypothetical protein n=1 Tax=Devosia submarina TaxID=1173082 RepID=UPI000D3DAB77|nr:hypothetical protein [Devosia submarina]